MTKMKYIYILISIALLTMSCSEGDKLTFSQTGKLTGKVVKANTFEPIENVKVTVSPGNNSVFTDENGDFEFEKIDVGDYSVQAEREGYLAGYEPVSISEDNTVNLIFELKDSDALNKPPTAPELLSPDDNSTGLDLEVELIWSTAQDEDEEDELTYGIQIRNDFDESLIVIESLADTTYVVNNLQHGVKYFWQVSVNDGHNADVLTPISTFETSSFPNNRYLFTREINGHSLIFSSDEEGENLLQLTGNDENCWRPRKNQTANLVAFLKTQDTETHIFTMNPDGTNIQQVTSAVPLVAFKQSEIDFSWSSNGSRILYPSFDKLYLINKDGSGNQLIYQTTNGKMITECDWSTDESIIVLKTNDINGYNTRIFTINMSGTELITILDGESGASGGLNISVDNQKLLYTRDISGFENASYRQLNTHIFVYDFSTESTADISEDKPGGSNDLDPRFSPNEAQIIFVNTSNDGISEKKIKVVDIDTSNRNDLFDNAYMPDWE